MDSFRVRMLSKYAGFEAGQVYWVDSWLAGSLVNKGFASLATAISDSDALTRPADTNAYTAGDEMNSATVQVKQKETLTLTGGEGTATITGAGGLSKVVTYNTSLTQTATDFVTAFAAAYLAVGITLTSSTVDLIFEATAAGAPFAVPVITPAETSTLAGTVAHTTANVTAVKQKETITLTGTFGRGIVTLAGGLTKIATFNTTLTQTATDFAASHVAAYLAVGIVLTSSTDTLIFEANVAGVSFTAPAIAYEASDLAGSVVHTTANVTAVKQKDTISLSGSAPVKQKETITLTGTSGHGVIELAGGLSREVDFDTDLGTTAGNFVTAYAADYLAQGIVLTASTVTLVLEAGTAGTAFTAPTITNLTGNMAGTVAHTTANVAVGTANITLAGGLTRSITFDTTLTNSADLFQTAFAADYLAQGIVLTTPSNTLVFEANVAGVSFTTPAITTVTGDLTGSVVNTTANRVAVKMKEIITLTGTIGFATVAAAGALTKVAQFNTNLTTTASDFVTANAAAYLGQAIVLTSSTGTLILEAETAGTGFTAPTITNTASDLAGSVAHTTANRVAVKQKETITVTGTAGEATIAAAGGLTKVLTFATSLTVTNSDFVTANAADYLAQGIVLTAITGNKLVFEANVAGTGFTAPTITTIDNVTGSIAHTTANVTFGTLTLTLNAGKITRVLVSTTNLAFSAKAIRLWFYSSKPTHVGDNIALINPVTLGDNASYVDLTFVTAIAGDTDVYAQATVDIDAAGSEIYVLVQALEAMTPVSEGVFNIKLTAQ